MDIKDFQRLKDDFKNADTEQKIELYIGTEGLSQTQYKELLRMFPLEELYRLEEALETV